MKKSAGKLSLVQTTLGSDVEAENLARKIVHHRLGACVQISRVHSVYRWNGAVEASDEHLLTVKTRAELASTLTEFITREHTYELPEIIVTEIDGGHTGYLEWVCMETAGVVP